MHDDSELVCRYVDAHAEDAFAALVERYLRLVYSTALRRVGGDTQLAEDVCQRVFIDLARKAATLRRRSSLAGWLYSGACVASAAIVRREQRRKAREAKASTMETPVSPSSPECDWSKLRPVLDDAIGRLREVDREAVLLRFFQQRSFAEVGAALRLTEEAARKRVDRALENLRASLAKAGIVSTATAVATALSAASVESPPGLAAKVTQLGLQAAPAATAAIGAALAQVLLPAVVLTGGGWLVAHQHAANTALRDELRDLSSVAAQVTEVRRENDALRRESAALATRTQAATTSSAARAAAALNAAASRPCTLTVTAEGTLRWGDTAITLDRFLYELQALNASGLEQATLVIRSEDATFNAFSYALEEARKVGINHVVVQREGAAEPRPEASWF